MVHFLTQEKLTEMTVILNPKQQELRDLSEEFKRKMDLMEKFDSDTLIFADDKQKLQQTLKKVNQRVLRKKEERDKQQSKLEQMRIEMREAREKIIVAEDIRLRILGEAENLRL